MLTFIVVFFFKSYFKTQQTPNDQLAPRFIGMTIKQKPVTTTAAIIDLRAQAHTLKTIEIKEGKKQKPTIGYVRLGLCIARTINSQK